MRPHQLSPNPGATHSRKRLGRGDGSRGTTSGKGTKGQKARAGGGVRPGFEGGQLPIIKRLPHTRGFHNIFKTEYAVVNVGQLGRLEGDDPVTPERLHAAGLIPSVSMKVKVLGDGDLSKAITVQAAKFSGSARSKIEAAGGHVITPGFGIEEPKAEAPVGARSPRSEAEQPTAAAEEAPAPARRRRRAAEAEPEAEPETASEEENA